MMKRPVREVRVAHPSRDGDGVAIQRIAGMRHAGMDPILMIDELRSEQREDFAGGFPPHPHRGMQTLTYMKKGGIRHEDSRGNRGEIRGGGAQWMSAGAGIVHSEMPTPDSRGLHGFQLWINLPAKEKMSVPRYRDIPATELVSVRGNNYRAHAIAGHWQLRSGSDEQQLRGPLEELEERASVLDLELDPRGTVSLQAKAAENLLVYIYSGQLLVDDVEIHERHLLVTGEGDELALQTGANGASALLLRGEPLREPVVHYGPFVMNTREEIDRAIADYQNGTFV